MRGSEEEDGATDGGEKKEVVSCKIQLTTQVHPVTVRAAKHAIWNRMATGQGHEKKIQNRDGRRKAVRT